MDIADAVRTALATDYSLESWEALASSLGTGNSYTAAWTAAIESASEGDTAVVEPEDVLPGTKWLVKGVAHRLVGEHESERDCLAKAVMALREASATDSQTYGLTCLALIHSLIRNCDEPLVDFARQLLSEWVESTDDTALHNETLFTYRNLFRAELLGDTATADDTSATERTAEMEARLEAKRQARQEAREKAKAERAAARAIRVAQRKEALDEVKDNIKNSFVTAVAIDNAVQNELAKTRAAENAYLAELGTDPQQQQQQ